MRKNFLFLLLVISIIGNLFLLFKLQAKQNINSQDQNYPYLSKRLFTERQNDILINFIPLRETLRKYIDQQNVKVGVYFEYLPSGVSIGVNDQLETRLASLVKIPLVMAIYKQIETGKLKKDAILTVKEEHIDNRFGILWRKGEGTKLTVQEAIKYTLIYSDNTAANLLHSIISPASIDHVFDSLDIPKNTDGKYHVISPKSYSSSIRSLYLSSYLQRKNSNEILEILTNTIFHDKIAASIPSNIKVAHKIGVFKSNNDPQETYSDCGIIYPPKRPYLLCIMTKSSEADAIKKMQNISKIIYAYISMY